jgi:hypothetical protein
VMRFVEPAEFATQAQVRAAVFSPGTSIGNAPGALTRLHRFLRNRPRPEQGLVIAKRRYESLGGHRDGTVDCEADLLRRLSRSIAVLRTAAIIID